MATILEKSERLGSVASGIVKPPTGTAYVRVAATMEDADVAAVGHTIGVAILRSADGCQAEHAASCIWRSGASRPG